LFKATLVGAGNFPQIARICEIEKSTRWQKSLCGINFVVTARGLAGHLVCMKSPLLIAAFSLFLTAPLWAQSDDSSSDSSTSTPPASGSHHHWHGHGGAGLTQDERTELKTAHDDAIKANPDLAAEGKRLHTEMMSYMKQMHDAMVKADPNVEPIMAKMGKGHHHHGPPPSSDDSSSQ
jgi:hypothetical protein